MSLRAPGNGMRMALLVPAAACAVWLAVASTASARIAPPGRTLVGSARSDTLVGGAGDDRIRGRGGSDRLVGGAGDDLLLARDGQEDLVACGRGRDRAVVDRLDRVVGCEEVDAPLGARSRPVLIGNGLSIGGGWQLAVERVVPDATALLLEPRARYGVPTVYPSSGAWLLARVQLRYVGTAPMAGIDQI